MRQLKNFLIKREQSQACLSFAKREKSRLLAKTLLTLALLLTAVTGAWADGIVCTASDLGKVLCTDGSIYENVSAATTAGKEAAAVIAYVDETNKNGLALALTDEGDYTWNNMSPSNKGKTAPEICSALNTSKAVTGGTWKLPSQDEWKQMFSANGGNEGSYTGLNTAIGNAGGTALQEYNDYWSSSEVYDDAWLVNLANGNASWDTEGKHYNRMVRACLAFDIAAASSGPEVAWNKAEKTGTFTMPGGNVTLEPEYYPQAALTAAPTAINDVPATTDGAIVKAGTVANIGSTETAQGTVMYYVSQTALDDDALLALAADQWTADVPTAKSLAQCQAYVYYYVRGNDSDNDEENFSDGDINTLTVTIAAVPTKVTMAVNDKTMGTAEVAGESKVEWTADTWKGWTQDIKEYTVDDITMTSSESARIREYISEDKYNNSLFFFVRKMYDDDIVTFSTTGDPFSRIEFTMIGDYSQYNPDIIPNDNWTFEGKSAVWEGEATKSLTLQSCTTWVSKITFFKGAVPDGVTVNGDGTFTVAKTATVTLKATSAEGYKFLYWEDDQTNTNPVRKVTIESGMADMTYKAVFAEILYNVTFAEGTDPNEWSATPNTDVKKGTAVTVTYTGTKKVIGVKAEKKSEAVENAYQKWNADQKKLVATEIPTTAIKVEDASTDVNWQGTYVVDGEVTINGKITLNGDVNLIIKDGAKLTAKQISGNSKNLSIYGQAQMTGEFLRFFRYQLKYK